MMWDKFRALLRSDKTNTPSASETIKGLQVPIVQPSTFENRTTIIQVKGRDATFMSSLPPADIAGGVNFITWLDDEEKKRLAILPSAAYLGVLVRRETQRKPNIFLANIPYLEFLHRSVAEIVPQLHEFTAPVKGQKTGTIFIFDGRFRDNDKSVPSENLRREEIIGVFEVRDGQIGESSYLRNTNYKVWSRLGPAQIPAYLRATLITKLTTMI